MVDEITRVLLLTRIVIKSIVHNNMCIALNLENNKQIILFFYKRDKLKEMKEESYHLI
jgi:hypothetical protein